ncbi:MAG: DUF4349 domain-containing protein [Spirochaetes bacterium]|nr:DUF4349 domain-containing protein [Spirochaetota bacterium]
MKKITAMVFMMFSVICTAAQTDTFIENYKFFIVHPVPSSAVSEIRKFASDSGGYTLSLNGYRLRVSVPVKMKDSFLQQIRKLGYVNDEMNSSSDVSQAILSLKTKIRVKKDYLAQLYSVFNDASYKETLEMEKEVNKTILEIESLEGELRIYEKSAQNAVFDITVSLDSGANNLREYGRSQFEWVNNLGLSNLMGK